MLLRADRVATGPQVFEPGTVRIAGERVMAVDADLEPDSGETAVDLGDVTLTAGFVDVHCHGGGGAAISDDPAAVLACHRAQGTTTTVASLVTQDLATLTEQLARLVPLVAAGDLAGIHLEGPWLAGRYKGAHPDAHLRDPDPAEVAELVAAGAGAVRMVTLAPERPGGLAAVALLAARGVVAALGHTEATFAEAQAAIAAGATGATHLFNAMPGLHHRAPGPLLALLADERVFLELIADGAHVDLDLVAWVMSRFPERVVLVTDAMAAAGCGDGSYRLGELAVDVRDGVARVAGTDTIAGSTLTLAAAVRTVIRVGVPWEIALRAATVNGARYLGLSGVGSLDPGSWADLVVLDSEWRVARVMRRGQWLS